MARKDPSLLQSGQVYDMTNGKSTGSIREYWDLARSLTSKTVLFDSSGGGPERVVEVMGHWIHEKTVLQLSLCVSGQ